MLADGLVKDMDGLSPHVYVPGDAEDISVELGPARPVILSDEIYQSIQMHSIVGDVEIGWIDAEIVHDSQLKEDMLLLPNDSLQKQGGIFIGDVKLSQLRRALMKASISSEFYAGGLYCEGDIIVKRTDGGLVLEGAVTDQYFAIRDIIYSQYHVC